MCTSFSLFPSFPRELQDYIWELAARPGPGKRHAHSFLIVDHYFQECSTKGQRSIDGDIVRIGDSDCQFRLAVPRNHNDSAYLIDAALWTTCQASRDAMRRRFSRNERWFPGPSFKNQPPMLTEAGTLFGKDEVAHTSAYVDMKGDTRFITVGYDDLIYLEGHNPITEEWHLHYAGDKYLMDRRHGSQPAPSFLGMNIALNLDEQWIYSAWGPPSFLVDFLCAVSRDCLRTLWFVDHRLERTSFPAPHRSREVFYSQDRIFTRVSKDDMTGDHPAWHIPGESKEQQALLWDLGDRIFDSAEGRMACDDCEVKWHDRWRVLACEYRY